MNKNSPYRRGNALLFSDGLSEATDSLGDEFGDQRLFEILSENQEKTAQAVCEQLWLAVQTHSGDSTLQDDFTIVVLKRFD